jgi:hypothetical protein
MIDFAQPVETTETPPRRVRVLFDKDGSAAAVHVGEYILSLGSPHLPALRNVAPPKPEPVLREAWVNCYAPDNIIGHATREEADRKGRPEAREACLRVAWMSDGSPVPGEIARDTGLWESTLAENERLTSERDKWKHDAEKAEADLGNLLAIMLGDGGHYQQECGTDSALKEAAELWYAYISLADNLKTDLAAARAALRSVGAASVYVYAAWIESYPEHAPAIAAARGEREVSDA